MAWNLNSDRPIYAQILEVIQLRIISGRYRPGEKIPSVRDLAAEAGVNPNTMQKALSELERNGLVETQRTSGRMVTEDMEMIQETRSKLAREQVSEFIDKMKELGFSKEEVVELLEKMGGEDA
ncbi:GntR family transcriptional regulator [Parablautia intestinalis]|jgi:GntR family transcriptional regulator|uniref:GntR family transcriptional regulator n=1 Tax=Parablautia intestinalis TaxID=2320100 RepID=A0A3A9ASS0_9FIRM|nr:GntR family transcriptional regulator [Parablautia intestinalis]MCI8614544.1 GntR family transcriptional regulator [Lachnospiraceae bacterium]MDE7047835.1 GntR family transcriptional regulator [Lachnospiraceae bacterium]RKI90286.1 GntR family transcriptional regulator [Parablautia intestinalis]